MNKIKQTWDKAELKLQMNFLCQNNRDVPDDPDQVFSAELQYKVRKNGTIK